MDTKSRTTKTDSRPIHVFMPEQGECGVMEIWFAFNPRKHERKWVEVRGNNVRDYDPEDEFHKLHDCRRINLSRLHAEETVTLLEGHPDYERFRKHLDADA